MQKSKKPHRVCPISRAGSLESRFRKMLQDPKRLFGEYIYNGMTVLDFGCGPGSFSIELAEMVGPGGKVIAADLQQGMLEILQKKIRGTNLEQIIKPHKTSEAETGVDEKVDFVLAFYVLHEVPNQKKLLQEFKKLMRPTARLFIAEPNFRVSKEEFAETLEAAESCGFKLLAKPKIFLSKAALFGV